MSSTPQSSLACSQLTVSLKFLNFCGSWGTEAHEERAGHGQTDETEKLQVSGN